MSQRSSSKFLSLVLRHDPGAIGLALDQGGWIEVDVLLDALSRHSFSSGAVWARSSRDRQIAAFTPRAPSMP